ncbi:hypothetical protein MLD38_021061 [Melastoma candidum]|uniref:Uncharacterized protein n=1 Tax=Melastoma candidum TaxID=119954 RepID=A0ACB9QF35_9MYRT|nr:hypothetical protein MLD38_021061 [Melastoma candidum]
MSSRDGKKPEGKPSGGIRTLADLKRSSAPGPDSDPDDPMEYYTGGEKSGMLVQDPSKGNDVDEIFSQARQMGALEGPVDSYSPSSSNSRSFTGTGRLLSGETVQANPTAPQQPEIINHNIVFWSNGFTVNDGPLRRLDDPENAPFLESIRRSECPKELEPADRRSHVQVKLMKRNEKCPEPVKRQLPFQGTGRTLSGSSSAANTSPEPSLTAGALSSAPPVVDDSLPATSIQLRLADGTRLIGRFNLNHTVGDIRSFINASRSGVSDGYQLQVMGFPPKLLTDPGVSIEHASLANSVVIQKL